MEIQPLNTETKKAMTIRPQFTRDEWIELRKQAMQADKTVAQYAEDVLRATIAGKLRRVV